MIERIKQIMSYYNLTSTSLADAIGVPRSSISHLLSGRNRPSLDFVMKLVKRFPEIDMYWLLNGKGEFPSKTKSTESAKKQPMAETNYRDSNIMTSQYKDEKSISKIIFFYEDGTFKTYQPKN